MSTIDAVLKPRKSPVQARSAATIDALHTAVIQVLAQDGLSRCTTTRIAERAGMSVGSLYQYYPNRDALLAAVLAKHLNSVAAIVERVCHEHRGMPISKMTFALVTAFLAEKLRYPQESRALYAVAGERGGPKLVADINRRMVDAVATMLKSAPNAHFDDPYLTSAIAVSALVGPVRAFLEGNLPAAFGERLEAQLVRLLGAYLQTYERRPRS